jgi:hypothetical protein
MGTKIIEKQITDTDNSVVSVKKILLSYDGSTLTASEIQTDEEDNETTTPYLVQPWKCNSDGTVENFVSEADAFAWVESNFYLF